MSSVIPPIKTRRRRIKGIDILDALNPRVENRESKKVLIISDIATATSKKG